MINVSYLNLIYKSAVLCKAGYCNKDVLILYKEGKSPVLKGYVFKFFDYNYFHLLGLKFVSSRYLMLSPREANIQFFHDVLERKLQPEELALRYGNATKLEKAIDAMSINNPRFTGPFIYNGQDLQASYGLGNASYTLCLESYYVYQHRKRRRVNKKVDVYNFPISLIDVDINKSTNPTYEVAAILVKEFKSPVYITCLYSTSSFKNNISTLSIEPMYDAQIIRHRVRFIRL